MGHGVGQFQGTGRAWLLCARRPCGLCAGSVGVFEIERGNFMRLCLFLLVLFASQTSWGGDYPNVGMIYNTKESSVLTYECTKLQNGKLECEFIQNSVRKKAKPADLQSKIKQAKDQYSDALKEIQSDTKVCKEADFFIYALSSKEPPAQIAKNAPTSTISSESDFIDGLKKMSDEQKQEGIKSFSIIKDFCNTKSEDSFLQLTKLEHDRASKTCIITSGYKFKQTFTYVDDLSSTAAWVVEGKPEGPCGLVQLSRFISDTSSTIGEVKFWKYLAKKAITNPDGLFLGTSKCSSFDEGEYLYDWKTGPETDKLYHMNCEYIEFSPL